MATPRKGTSEILVGLFLSIGLGILGVLAVTFGRMSNTLGKPYDLTVIFANASGLSTGADVLLAGARVGYIGGTPQLLGDSYRVAVKLKVQESVKIPRKSKFMVGSANLLGDKYVDIVPSPDMDTSDVWQPGEVIEGSRAGGFEELAARGGDVLEQLSVSLKQIQTLTTSINERVLTEANVQNLGETFANLKETTASFKKTSLSIDNTLGKVGDVTERAGRAVDSFQKLGKTANEGKGALGVLVSDKETAENLKALIANLRRSGVLFYRDRPLKEDTKENKEKNP
ncbi:MAG: MCE family protein [Verrucomicrobia bacterium]|nr:MCE family protein [Verrucomicrobiota bacterium]